MFLPTNSLLSPENPAALKPLINKLIEGQLLNALVLRQTQPGKLNLQIGNKTFTANTAETLAAGDKVKLQVLETEGKLQLKIMERQPAQTTTSIRPTQTPFKSEQMQTFLTNKQQLLRQTLPQQKPIVPVLKNLLSPANPNTQTAATLSSKFNEAITVLKTVLPDKQTVVQPQGLKQAMQSSGVFLEPRIAELLHKNNFKEKILPLLKQDLKSNLIKLGDILAKTMQETGIRSQDMRRSISANMNTDSKPASINNNDFPELIELKQQLDSAIARITINQAKALPSGEQLFPVWTFEVPFKDGDEMSHLELTVTEEQTNKPDNTQETMWRVILNFELTDLGKIQARIILHNETISSTLWAEQPATFHAIEDHLPLLEQQLEKTGLAVQTLECYPGTNSEASDIAPINERLLNISL